MLEAVGGGRDCNLPNDAEVQQDVGENLSGDREAFKGGVQETLLDHPMDRAGQVLRRGLDDVERDNRQTESETVTE